MQTNNGFFIRINDQLVPVSEEVYRAYKRPLWAERKRKERRNRCLGAGGSRCADDCGHCGKQRTGSVLSLDMLIKNGFDIAVSDDFTRRVEQEQLLQSLRTAISTLDELDRLIVLLFANGTTEREIAATVGLSQTGVNKRKCIIFAALRHYLKKYT